MMRNETAQILNEGRVRLGPYASDVSDGLMGKFLINGPCGVKLLIISTGHHPEWEHVSVSIRHRIPSWQEMCFVKDLFWDDDVAVMQLHPPKADYINMHPYCLHLWRPIAEAIPLPPSSLVGVNL